MIQLIIKGSEEESMKELVKRGIEFIFKASHKAYNCTTVEVDDYYEHRIVTWYCAYHGRAPFPVGTLLHYTFKEDK